MNTIRRILVAVDASPQSLAALEAAAQLASELGAELVGVYVEDINLLRLAALPTVLETGGASARSRPMDERRMSQQLRSQAVRAARATAAAAGRTRVRWSFTVARGSIETELRQAASTADLFVIGRAGWSGKRGLGSTARAMIAAGPARTMVIERVKRLRPTIMVVYDGEERSQRAFDTAISLAQAGGGFLVVGILAAEVETAKTRQTEAAELLRSYGIEARYRWLLHVDVSELAEMVRSQEDCILILPGESALFEGMNLPEALDEFNCPVLLVQ